VCGAFPSDRGPRGIFIGRGERNHVRDPALPSAPPLPRAPNPSPARRILHARRRHQAQVPPRNPAVRARRGVLSGHGPRLLPAAPAPAPSQAPNLFPAAPAPQDPHAPKAPQEPASRTSPHAPKAQPARCFASQALGRFSNFLFLPPPMEIERLETLLGLQEIRVLGSALSRNSSKAIHEVMFTVDTQTSGEDPKFDDVVFAVVEWQSDPDRLRFVVEARVTPDH